MSADFANVYDDLAWRGLVYNATPGARDILGKGRATMYIGFDPTAKSLHIGNLIPIMALVRMQLYGHTPIALVGGGTGMIGDPSGRSEERSVMAVEEIDSNLRSIHRQLENFLDFDDRTNPAIIVNNAEWLRPFLLMDFLRNVGKHFSVNSMLGRESVKARLKTGITFTEFSYQLLQAFDFLQLHDRYRCAFQGGGSDQWGNILGGVDLIRRVRQTEAHGIVYPLIVSANGEKFGKSVGGAPTLDPNETTPLKLYQFFLNTEDEEVVKYLKLFTLLSVADIEELAAAVKTEPSKRAAQKRLAAEITRAVHGEDGLQTALKETAMLFGGQKEARLPSDAIVVPQSDLAKRQTVLDLLTRAVGGRGDVKRLTEQGGLRINDVALKQEDLFAVAQSDMFRFVSSDGRRYMVVKRGKKRMHVMVLE